jgi:hypothetical protein
VTEGSGSYSIPNLPTGPYKLEASLQGFRTYVQTGIVLQVNGNATINVSLATDPTRSPSPSRADCDRA